MNESRALGPWKLGRALGLLLMLSCALLVSACGDSDSGSTASPTSGTDAGESTKKFTVAVLHGAVFSDGGYGQMQLAALEKAMGNIGSDRFELQKIEKVPYTAQMTTTATQALQQNDLLIDIASGGQLIYDACKKFPDKYCLTFYPVGEMPTNTAGFWVDISLSFYLEGVAAGKLTQSGKLGFVGAVRSPTALGVLNSYALGCQSVRPDCEVRNIYVNSFHNPPRAVEATNTLVDGGADVISHYMNDPSVLETAAKRDVWAFALYTDQESLAPDKYVMSNNFSASVEKSFEEALRSLVDGDYVSELYLGGEPIDEGNPMDYGLTGFGPNVPQDVQDAVKKAYDEISSGTSPYQGPIEDSKGKVRVPDGESLDPRGEFVYSGWDYAVKGVVGG